MTEGIDGDWRMLVEEEPPGPENIIYTFRDGSVMTTDGKSAGSYSNTAHGYRITLGASVCSVRPLGSGAIDTLTGEIDHGEWSDPVVFYRVKYDIRSPDSLR